MQHRAPRPLLDSWRRLRRATAHCLGQVADADRTRVLAPLIALTLAIGGCAGVASLTDEPSAPKAESPAPTADGSQPTEPRAEFDGPTPVPSETPSATPSSGPSPTPSPTSSPTSDASPSVPPKPSDESRPRSTGSPTPTTSPSTTAEDDTPPSTTLSAAYPEPDAAEFSFSASEDASFACSIDGAAYVSCDSAQLYSDLTPGWHTFAVRATDTAENTDPSPAETRWKAKNAHAGDAEGG